MRSDPLGEEGIPPVFDAVRRRGQTGPASGSPQGVTIVHDQHNVLRSAAFFGHARFTNKLS